MAEEERRIRGRKIREEVSKVPPRELATPLEELVTDVVFGEIWARPGLDTRTRRWISLTCTAWAGVEHPLRAHVASALQSGDVTVAEINEFALHFAAYAGVPKATLIVKVLRECVDGGA